MSTLNDLFVAIPGQWEKVIATFLLIAFGMALSHLWARYLARGEISAEKRRIHLVWARNVIWFWSCSSSFPYGHRQSPVCASCGGGDVTDRRRNCDACWLLTSPDHSKLATYLKSTNWAGESSTSILPPS
jgi:hypothetical protein